MRTPRSSPRATCAVPSTSTSTGPTSAAAVGELSKDGEYALYCRSGNRSATALATMKDLGFTHAYHLGGGIGAWTAAGGEVVTD